MSRKLDKIAAEMGKAGGKAVFEKRGSQYMSDLAKKSMTGKKREPNYFKNISAIAAEARKAKKKRSGMDKVADILNGK